MANEFCEPTFSVLTANKVILDRIIDFAFKYPDRWTNYNLPTGRKLHECVELDDVEEWILKNNPQQVVDFLMNLFNKANMQKVARDLASFCIKYHFDADYIELQLNYYSPKFLGGVVYF